MANSLLNLEGFSLFPLQYNCAEGFDISFEYQRSIRREPGTTVNHVFFHGTAQPCAFSMSFWATGRDGVYALLTALYAIKGRVMAFWLPLPIYTISPTANFGGGSANIQIQKTGWEEVGMAGKRIYIEDGDGTRYTRSIASIASEVGHDLVVLDDPITPVISPNSINYTCLLLFGRLDIDEVEVKYEHTGFAEFTTNFIELPFEHPA
jgi:hypothetical protein